MAPREKLTPFAEAFRDVVGELPTPYNVEWVSKNPDLKRQIDEQMAAIIEMREHDDALLGDKDEEPK